MFVLTLLSLASPGGVLRDGLLPRQSTSSLRAVLAPKLTGSANTAASLRHQPLQQHVLFSSVASLLGNAGQANYSAANAALDAAAQLQRQQGTASVSLQWGPWAGAGMASPGVAASLAAKGVGLVQPPSGLRLLDSLIGPAGQPSSTLAAFVALDWRRMLRPAQQRSPFFAAVAPTAPTPVDVRALPPMAAVSTSCAPVPSVDQVLEEVQRLVAGALGATVDPTAALMSAGLDSLGEQMLF